MRLSADQIRQAIVHPDWDVRDIAFRYFQESFSTDPTVMPQLITAVEKYGWEEAFSPAIRIHPLRQTAETVGWLVEQLKQPCPDAEREPLWNCWLRFLSWQLSAAPVDLLVPLESALEGMGGLDLECREIIQKRMGVATMDPETGWRELEAYSRQMVEEFEPIEFAEEDLKRFAEVIARGGDTFKERVLALLDESDDELADDDPTYWMKAAATHVAGSLQLPEAVPLLVERLDADVCNDGQWYCYVCTDALIRIGSDDVVRAVVEMFPQASWDFRSVSSRIFEGIHSEFAVREGLALMAGETDSTLRACLAEGLVIQFDDTVIEPIRNLLLLGEWRDDEDRMIRRLVALATALNVSIPELEPWRSRARAVTAEFRQAVEERLTEHGRLPDDWDNDFDDEEGMYDYDDEYGTSTFEDIIYDDDKLDDDLDDLATDFGDFLAPARTEDDEAGRPIVNFDPKVGRNDPCPCGSGKKFKKCCMNRQKNPPKIDW